MPPNLVGLDDMVLTVSLVSITSFTANILGLGYYLPVTYRWPCFSIRHFRTIFKKQQTARAIQVEGCMKLPNLCNTIKL